ncbi:uncharacterized protein LOC131941514 isoform X2 [Physella acuta]|uniref:uncharacterized protein LOC131941514 isoform X2 n=1 Tax=Physella acuta TaxID=109671 RepID=UPI0027DD6024|nr:uncharacterized protein LOC131941514 isoform X2 [Physella acuta]
MGFVLQSSAIMVCLIIHIHALQFYIRDYEDSANNVTIAYLSNANKLLFEAFVHFESAQHEFAKNIYFTYTNATVSKRICIVDLQPCNGGLRRNRCYCESIDESGFYKVVLNISASDYESSGEIYGTVTNLSLTKHYSNRLKHHFGKTDRPLKQVHHTSTEALATHEGNVTESYKDQNSTKLSLQIIDANVKKKYPFQITEEGRGDSSDSTEINIALVVIITLIVSIAVFIIFILCFTKAKRRTTETDHTYEEICDVQTKPQPQNHAAIYVNGIHPSVHANIKGPV